MRDQIVHEGVLRDVVTVLEGHGLGVAALVTSPLRGADGNIEFFVRARRGAAEVDAAAITRVVADAHGVAA